MTLRQSSAALLRIAATQGAVVTCDGRYSGAPWRCRGYEVPGAEGKHLADAGYLAPLRMREGGLVRDDEGVHYTLTVSGRLAIGDRY